MAFFRKNETKLSDKNETLVENEKRFRDIFENSAVGESMVSLDGRWLDVNKRYCEMMGYSKKELIGKPFASITYPEDLSKSLEALRNLLSGKISYCNLEKRYIRKDKSIIWVLLSIAMFSNGDGKPHYFIVHTQDISEFKETENMLKESEQKLSVIFHASPNLMAITRLADGKIMDVNDAFTSMLGYSAAEAIGKTTKDLLIWINPTDRDSAVKNLNKEGDTTTFETMLRKKDGTAIPVIDSVRVIKFGDKLCAISIINDITGRKKMELDIMRVDRALKMISDVNQALVYIRDEDKLLNEICKIIVNSGGYRFSWIGYAEHDENKTVRAVAEAGFDEGYLKSANIVWADVERGRGPVGTAIRNGEIKVAQDITKDSIMIPWRQEAVKRNYHSLISLPLKGNGQTFGVLNIYSDKADAFNDKEVGILKELAEDLAFGIVSQRIRVENNKKEKELEASELKYATVVERGNDGILIVQDSLIKFANSKMIELTGYTTEEFFKKPFLSFVSPESVKVVGNNYKERMLGKKVENNYRIGLVRKDEKIILVEISGSIIDYEGRPADMAFVTDITEKVESEESEKKRIEQIEKINQLSVGRELKMIELKKEIKELEEKLAKNKI